MSVYTILIVVARTKLCQCLGRWTNDFTTVILIHSNRYSCTRDVACDGPKSYGRLSNEVSMLRRCVIVLYLLLLVSVEWAVVLFSLPDHQGIGPLYQGPL